MALDLSNAGDLGVLPGAPNFQQTAEDRFRAHCCTNTWKDVSAPPCPCDMCGDQSHERIPDCLVNEELDELVGHNAALDGLELLTANRLRISHAHRDCLSANSNDVDSLNTHRNKGSGQYSSHRPSKHLRYEETRDDME